MRAARWSGIRSGDLVDVAGTRLRGATWTFVAHVSNPASGDEWVEVVGGRPGERKVRSFGVDLVYPVGGLRRVGGTSPLASAPQLPLG